MNLMLIRKSNVVNGVITRRMCSMYSMKFVNAETKYQLSGMLSAVVAQHSLFQVNNQIMWVISLLDEGARPIVLSPNCFSRISLFCSNSGVTLSSVNPWMLTLTFSVDEKEAGIWLKTFVEWLMDPDLK